MDLTINVENYKLNIRAAGIIEHNGKILVHKEISKDHYALIGGRVKIGENSETTIKREIKEELGKKVKTTGYIATIENFFEEKGQKYHEILFVHKAEFINEEDKKIEHTLKNVEGKENLHYEWIEISKIDEYKILPEAIKEILKENKIPVHKINNDLKNEFESNEVNNILSKNTNNKREKCCGCIIINDNKVLLIKQIQGHWGFPKGHVEKNETELETAAREVKEETNLEVEIDANKRYTMEYETDKGTLKQVVLFVAKCTGGEIKAQECEVNEIKWLDFDEAVKTITYENTRELFKKILKDIKE